MGIIVSAVSCLASFPKSYVYNLETGKTGVPEYPSHLSGHSFMSWTASFKEDFHHRSFGVRISKLINQNRGD